jgi:hypothetical protein
MPNGYRALAALRTLLLDRIIMALNIFRLTT